MKNKIYMKKMNRNEWIAVAAGMALMAFLFFGGAFLNLFNQPNPAQVTMQEIPETGVQKEDVIVGQGDLAAAGDTITVNYVGTLPDGKVFDSSYDRRQPLEFTLGVGQVIRGWDEGVMGMRVGGKRRLVIAPDYGYGAQSVGPIPANSTLIFEVELLNVEKPNTAA
jgi:FKBP-type peptidyl-prolyl cis-trans isomerase